MEPVEDGGWQSLGKGGGALHSPEGRRLPLPQAVTPEFPVPGNALYYTTDVTEDLRTVGLGGHPGLSG